MLKKKEKEKLGHKELGIGNWKKEEQRRRIRICVVFFFL